jgi:hypothetical protein
LHELTHVLGRDAGAGNIGFFTGPGATPSNPNITADIGILDLFRFSKDANNVVSSQFNDTSGAYLSYNAEATNEGYYDFSPTPQSTGHDPGDFAHITGINDGADAFFQQTIATFNGKPIVGVPNDISNFDIDMMGVIGYKHADINAHTGDGGKTESPLGLSYHVKST